MFLETEINKTIHTGKIEVICGSMFSGKTEELIRRLKRVAFANLKTMVFKPVLDNRYDKENVVSHDARKITSTTIKCPSEMLKLTQNIDVIGIDEAQFFSDNLVEVCNNLAAQGKRIIVAGLDMDFLGNPFGVMPKLLAIAEHITKVQAVCVDCGGMASYSFRLTKNTKLVELGEKNEYKALCRKCFNNNMQ